MDETTTPTPCAATVEGQAGSCPCCVPIVTPAAEAPQSEAKQAASVPLGTGSGPFSPLNAANTGFVLAIDGFASRELHDHKLNGLNDAIQILVLDPPGPGNASHHYLLRLIPHEGPFQIDHSIKFQCGPILEAGYNGISNEALLAVVIDRLRGFQSGQYACRENAVALTKIEEALMWLQKRTRDRLQRGVEGTNQK